MPSPSAGTIDGSHESCFVVADDFWGWEDSGLPPDSAGTVLTVGTFDGVHRGHQTVLGEIAKRAADTGLHSVLLTFDPHPLEVVNPAKAPQLLTIGVEKLEVVAESGVGYMAILPFTPALREYSAAQFVDEVLRKRFHVRELVIGYDHHFGRGREGRVEVLQELGNQRGFRVDVVRAVTGENEQPVSSSAIRQAIASGDLDKAAAGLGRPYSISGVVLTGEGRGRLLGYPTINLGAPHPRKLLPPTGVYAIRAHTPMGAFGGMMNLGPRPTFGDAAVTIEVHLFEAEANFYGSPVKVEFVQRIRNIMNFTTPEALVAQLREDADQARRALTLFGEVSNVQVSPAHPIH
ncbi:MAG: bifunctional riboflavin kinase/FAD synthetase [Anaerolineae bacterium]|nr:bifunctional riboflavin kinase/FAD synthetase [Gemmatimonadaceae bacterium]